LCLYTLEGVPLAITGEGLRKVLLVSQNDWVAKHFMLDRLINRSGGLDRSYFYFASLQDQSSLADFIRDNGVKVVVPLGEPVLNRLAGEKDILRWRGRTMEWGNGWMVPTFAPHKLLPENPSAAAIAADKARGIATLSNPPRFQGTAMLDLEWAIHVARHGFERKKASYIVDPTPTEFEKWVEGYLKATQHADPNDPEFAAYLSWDVETVYKAKKKHEDDFEESESTDLANGTLLRASFSFAEYTGSSVPWSPPYLDAIRALLSSPGPKVGWNDRAFDQPVVENVGMVLAGELHDGMDAWHVYQSDLPKGLEFVSSYTSDLLPWKHLNNSDPGLYSAIDADAALRNFLWVKRKLQSTGQWELYYNLYHRVMTPLTAAKKRGNFIDIARRDSLKEEMAIEMAGRIAGLQKFVPDEVRPRQRYIKRPKDLVHVDGVFIIPEHVDGAERRFESVPVEKDVKTCSFCGEKGITKGTHITKGGKKNPCAGSTVILTKDWVPEWDEILEFNPNSTQQLIAYAKFFGHPVGTNMDDATKDAFDSAHIKEILTGKLDEEHVEFYSEVLLIKKLQKTLGTYIYNPDEAGLIHQTYKNAPSTPRLSGAAYNLMNVGKREDNKWAVKAREQIIARPGHRFVQADSSAIEAVIQGYWMGDENYMRLATQSVHAWVVAMENGIEWTGSEEQVSYLKANYKDAYNKMKTANYLTNFGGSPYLMWKTDRKSFPTKKAAEDTQGRLFAMLPKLPEYHHWVRTKAQKEAFLTIPGWNFRHYYYDVFMTDPKTGKLKYGKDSKKVVALYPQGCAALFLRENTLLLAYGDEACEWLDIEPLGLSRGWMDSMPANFAVHDGYTLEVLDGLEGDAVSDMEKVLTRPIKHLSNLRVGCEIDVSPVGGNWSPHHPVKNPMGLETIKTVRVEVVAPPMRMAA
jgi:hypothetical protein